MVQRFADGLSGNYIFETLCFTSPPLSGDGCMFTGGVVTFWWVSKGHVHDDSVFFKSDVPVPFDTLTPGLKYQNVWHCDIFFVFFACF